MTDRFGTHGFKKVRTEMLCTPAVGGSLPPPPGGFQIEFPETDVYPNADLALCYHFRTPNAATLPVQRFISEYGPSVERMMVFTTTDTEGHPVDHLPSGIVSAVDCSPLPTGQVVPHWRYEAHQPTSALEFPSDDGTGKPVALEIPPLSSGFILLHVVNTGNDVIKARATLSVEPLDSPVYAKTDTYTAYSSTFSIPPLTNGVVEARSCSVPADAEFWRLSTFTHKQATQSLVRDGTNVVLLSTDWSQPTVETLPAPPFRTFASKKLTYTCIYDNPANRTIFRGESFLADEECMAVGYFFPATRPLRCVNGFGPF